MRRGTARLWDCFVLLRATRLLSSKSTATVQNLSSLLLRRNIAGVQCRPSERWRMRPLPSLYHRAFASSAEEGGQQELEQLAESNRLRFAKYLAVCMLAAVALKVLPALGQNSVEHALMLTESREAFWKKAGLERVRLIAKSDAAAQKLLDRGAAQLLVGILQDSGEDAELAAAALQAVAELARLEAAREAFVLAGLAEALERIAAQSGPNLELAQQLLVVCKVQRDHVD